MQYIPNQGYVRLQPQLQSNHVYITLLSTPVFCDSTTSTAAFGHNNLGPRFFQFSDDPAFICWQSGSRRNRDYYVTTTDSTMFSASLIDATQWSQREIRVWSVELNDGNWKADLQCGYTRKVHDRNIIPLGISPGFSMTHPTTTLERTRYLGNRKVTWHKLKTCSHGSCSYSLTPSLIFYHILKSPLEALRIFKQKPITFWFGKMTTGTLSPEGSTMFSDDPSVFFNSKMA